jgi:hypothetical protein
MGMEFSKATVKLEKQRNNVRKPKVWNVDCVNFLRYKEKEGHKLPSVITRLVLVIQGAPLRCVRYLCFTQECRLHGLQGQALQ